MKLIRILVAEDSNLLRHLLARQLSIEPDFEIVGEVKNGQEALTEAERLRPDVVLMDLDMPVVNGLQATLLIQNRLPQTRVVLLTAHEELANFGQLIGAVRCLKKSCTPSELATCIREVATVSEDGDAAENQNLHEAVARIAIRAALTDRERRVLQKLVATTLSIQQIAAALEQETGETVTESAVKHTTDRVMRKLGIEPRTRPALIRKVLADSILE